VDGMGENKISCTNVITSRFILLFSLLIVYPSSEIKAAPKNILF